MIPLYDTIITLLHYHTAYPQVRRADANMDTATGCCKDEENPSGFTV